QQDALLPWVENGTVILIGATTENPYFEVNKALISRSRIFQLKSLEAHHLAQILTQTLEDRDRGYGHTPVQITPEAQAHFIQVANGDARSLLNALELAVETTPPQADGSICIDLTIAEDSIQQRAVLYDKEGDAHFDTISAFIKSVRGSDPDAALYWLARMIYAGEDPRFILRRLLILACEDIGLADPHAVAIVQACADTFDRIGLPEGRYPLAQATLYLATAPKSNSVMGFFDAIATVQQEQVSSVPNPLKDANRDKEALGHGADYLYPHAYRDHWVAQQYLPETLQGKQFYQPSNQGYENQIKTQVLQRREAQQAALSDGFRDPHLEILTYSNGNPATEQWLQRTLSQTGEKLAQIRDRLFASLRIQRHDVILDLNAGNGLLTWEALRRSPEGGVYSVVQSPAEQETLTLQAANLDGLQRPQILHCTLPDLAATLESLFSGLTFDHMIGRNVFMGSPAKETIAAVLQSLRTPKTTLAIVETIPQRGQRLYALLDLTPLAPEMRHRFITAEESIYTNPADPLVNWDDHDLAQILKTAGFTGHISTEVVTTDLYISTQLIQHWFTPQPHQARAAYIDHLAKHFSPAEIQAIYHCFEKQLQNQTVSWQTTLLWIYDNATPASPEP
ncbi:MAG: AAA family ATPase, partial [Prochlorotrichaceae cyanobacterium]